MDLCFCHKLWISIFFAILEFKTPLFLIFSSVLINTRLSSQACLYHDISPFLHLISFTSCTTWTTLSRITVADTSSPPWVPAALPEIFEQLNWMQWLYENKHRKRMLEMVALPPETTAKVAGRRKLEATHPQHLFLWGAVIPLGSMVEQQKPCSS